MLRTSIAAAISELLREVRLRPPEHPDRDRQGDQRERERVAEVCDKPPVRPVGQQGRDRANPVLCLHVVEAGVEEGGEKQHEPWRRAGGPRARLPTPPCTT